MAHVGLKRRPMHPPKTEPRRSAKNVMKLARQSAKNVAVATAGRMLPEKQQGDRPGLELKKWWFEAQKTYWKFEKKNPENLLEV